MGVVSGVTGVVSSYEAFKDGKILEGTLDAAGAVVGGAAAFKGYQTVRAGVHMRNATTEAVAAKEAGDRIQSVGLNRLAEVKYSEYERLAAQAKDSSVARRTLKERGEALERTGVPLNVASLAESHRKDLVLPPRLPAYQRISAFGLP